MTPLFCSGSSESPPPPVYVAEVGPHMVKVAEVGRNLAERNTFVGRSIMLFYGPTPSLDAIGELVTAARS